MADRLIIFKSSTVINKVKTMIYLVETDETYEKKFPTMTRSLAACLPPAGRGPARGASGGRGAKLNLHIKNFSTIRIISSRGGIFRCEVILYISKTQFFFIYYKKQ